LSRLGRQVWLQAKEDGLWNLLLQIPRSNFLDFEVFTDYFNERFFFDYQEFLSGLEERVKPELVEDQVVH